MSANEAPQSSQMSEIVGLIEAVLFASTEPVSREELREVLEQCPDEQLDAGLERLEAALEDSSRGLQLQRIAGGYRLVTREALAEPLRRLFRFRNRKRLTPATLDVLSIVAYAQPITTPEIQEIRGADPAYALGVLQERRLVRVVGRKRVVGRPMLYGTTPHFLIHFGLDSLDDLPSVEAYGTRVMPAQRRLFPVAGPDEEELDGIEPLEDGEDPQPGLMELDPAPDAGSGAVVGLALAAEAGEPDEGDRRTIEPPAET